MALAGDRRKILLINIAFSSFRNANKSSRNHDNIKKKREKNWKILNYSVLVFIADNIFRSASGRIPF